MPHPTFRNETRNPISRRRVLATSASLCGLTLPSFLRLKSATAEQSLPQGGKAKSCIIVYLWGGMSHLESLDLKPKAPVEIRGEFSPISTSVPGIHISQHMPLLAQQTDKLAIIRFIHNFLIISTRSGNVAFSTGLLAYPPNFSN